MALVSVLVLPMSPSYLVDRNIATLNTHAYNTTLSLAHLKKMAVGKNKRLTKGKKGAKKKM